MRPPLTAIDPELETLTVKAETAAGRIRAHDRFCALCATLDDPSTAPCRRRQQLASVLIAARALVNARRRALHRA